MSPRAEPTRRARRPGPPTRFIALAAALGLVLRAAPEAPGAVAVGDLFPAVAMAGPSGAAPQTPGQVVLVDFWASWCAPCKASFPAYARLNADYAARGLVILAVSVDQDPDAFELFVKRMRPPFFVALDRDQRLVTAVDVPTMPTSYLIDRKGRVRYLHPGYHGPESEAAMRREIETLLAEKAS